MRIPAPLLAPPPSAPAPAIAGSPPLANVGAVANPPPRRSPAELPPEPRAPPLPPLGPALLCITPISVPTRNISVHGVNAASAKMTTPARIVATECGMLPLPNESPDEVTLPASASTITTTGLSITNISSNIPRRLTHIRSAGQMPAASATGKNSTAM